MNNSILNNQFGNIIERKLTDVLFHSLKDYKNLDSFVADKNNLKNIIKNAYRK